MQGRVKEISQWKAGSCVNQNFHWSLALQGSLKSLKSYKVDEGAACNSRFPVRGLRVWICIYPEACIGKYRHKGDIETFLIRKDMNKVRYQAMYYLVDVSRISQRYSVSSNPHSVTAMTDFQSVVFEIFKGISRNIRSAETSGRTRK